ncbi:MAG TPA: response regulator [Lacipirellulaceae bacterium]|nr:response regulator [Lacipirellulaceae bacterium]
MKAQSIRALVVDDDSADAELTRRALAAIVAPRYCVEGASSLKEAIERLANTKYDVVLLDLGLPDSQRNHTLERVREACRNEVPVIVLTGLDDETMALDAVDAGAQDYITKDAITPDLLGRTIRYALARQHLLHQLKSANDLLAEKNARLAKLYNTAQQFVENVSHEFRTPLTVIREFTSIIRDGLDGPVTVKQCEHLNKVLHRTDDLALMVDDMLDISRLEAGLLGIWRRSCHVSDVIENVVSQLNGRAASKNISLSFDVPPNLPTIYCDDEKARRVIINLAVNAIKFAPEAGTVDIWARLCSNQEDIEIGVHDNGPGISKENLEPIFERFRQVDQGLTMSTKGFGLGLNIAKELVSLNLGQIRVESEIARGSTFSFTVPRFEPGIVFDRYLKRLTSLTDKLPEICLATVEVNTAQVERTVIVDEFLHRSVRASDLVIPSGDSHWVIATACSEPECDQLIQRLMAEWNGFARNCPHLRSAPLEIENRGAWPTNDQREDLIGAFVELCESNAPKTRRASTVLIVDDDREVNQCLSVRLQSAGFEVLSAADGEKGLDSARLDKPDAIVLDVRMPKKDGLTVLRELRADTGTKNIPVVMLSASIRDQQDALQAGANYFVRKPYEAEDVLSAIESSLGEPVS